MTMSTPSPTTTVQSTPLPKAPGTSLHRQLFLVLRDQIVRAHWRPGDVLPTEEALCEQFAVSRITVRRALADLATQGFVERRHGLGTYVLEGAPAARQQANLTFLDGLRKTMLETKVEVLNVERKIPPPDIAAQLQLGPDEKAVHALRLRRRDGQPLMVTDAWVPERLGAKVSPATLGKKALYEILQSQGVKFGRVIQEIAAETAGPEHARLLQTEVGAPLLVMIRLIHDTAAKPIQHIRVYLSAERSRVLMDIPGSQLNTLSAGQIVHDTPAPNKRKQR